MTFDEFKTRTLADVFPDGAPENLETWLGRAAQSALVEIQRVIPCFQYRHVDVTPACNIFWQAGSAVVTAPKGQLVRVYSVDPAADPNWAQPTFYQPVRLSFLRRWQARWRRGFAWDSSLNAPGSGVAYGMGFDKITATSDSPSGRAVAGLHALDPGANQLWIAPWLQSTESLVVEWQGIKREWASADEVPDSHDFLRLARLFVELEFGRKFAAADLAIRESAYREAMADMLATCRQEQQTHGDPASAEELDAAYWSAFVPETVAEPGAAASDTVICFVGDTQNMGADVAAELPAGSKVVLLGNCKSPGGDAVDDMEGFADFLDVGGLKTVLGVNELDDGTLGADVRALAANPGNGRYYEVTWGPVTVFVVDSGVDSSDDVVEPDGNFEGSVQYAFTLSAILRNTSPWKILCVHHPLFTSSSTSYPGLASVRWLNRMPVHAVICGGARVYERLTVAGRDSFTVGTGGAELHEFRPSPYPGSQAREAEFGFLKLTASCTAATLEFVDLDGSVLDTLELSDPGEPYVTPTTDVMDPAILDHPAGSAVVVGLPYELTVEASGTAPLSYQWQEDGEDMAGENTDTLAIAAVSATHQYRVLVSNTVGGTMSRTASVTAVSGTVSTVATLTIFRSNSYPAAGAIALGADGNGEAAYFVPGGSGTDDGVNEIIDSGGRHFLRWRFT